MSDHRFLELSSLLDPGDLLIVNNTRVRAARLKGRRAETGGAVELLLLGPVKNGWSALARPSRRLRPGVRLEFGRGSAEVVTSPIDGKLTVRFDTPDVEGLLSAEGEVPLPPYFVGDLEDPDRYQTMFARDPGSAAAPTAGLHFTPEVLERVADRGVEIAEVELHVSLDTFRPISVDDLDDHRMHTEWCSISSTTAGLIGGARDRGARVIAVGTTVVRTLESRSTPEGYVKPGEGATDLFIRPGFEFRVVDALITNFHLPGSTLLVLLASFMGPRWRDVYNVALERGYRFLSFGDSMFTERTGT